jgi:hypothetical protein
MSSATVDLYNALIEAGVDKEKAKTVADKIVTSDDAVHFATKSDVSEMKADLQSFLFMALVTQAVFIIGVVVGLIELIG